MRTIAVDVDGVLADMHEEWIKRYNRDYGDSITKDHLKQWEMHKVVKPECGAKIYDYLADPTLYDDVKRIANSFPGVKALREKYKVIFVSACVVGSTDSKMRWMQRAGFIGNGLSPTTFIACADKSLIKADVLIDDRTNNLDGFKGRTVLFTQPWNLKATGYQRLNSWYDLGYFLEGGL